MRQADELATKPRAMLDARAAGNSNMPNALNESFGWSVSVRLQANQATKLISSKGIDRSLLPATVGRPLSIRHIGAGALHEG